MGRDWEKEPSILRIFPRDLAKFHQFWKWEYLRRNSEYRRVYDEYTQNLKKLGLTDDNPVPSQEQKSNFTAREQRVSADINMAPKAFFEKFKMWPKNYLDGEEPGGLIKLINLYQKEYDRYTQELKQREKPEEKEKLLSIERGIYSEIDYIAPDTGRVEFINYKWPLLTVELNLEEDIEASIKGLRLECLRAKENHYISESLEKTAPKDEETSSSSSKWAVLDEADKKKICDSRKEADKLERELIERENKLIQAGGAQRARPRAVGLWLWDHYNKSGRKRGAMQKAVDAFSAEIATEDSPIFFPEIGKYESLQRLREILRITKKCVEEVKVHPMK